MKCREVQGGKVISQMRKFIGWKLSARWCTVEGGLGLEAKGYKN